MTTTTRTGILRVTLLVTLVGLCLACTVGGVWMLGVCLGGLTVAVLTELV